MTQILIRDAIELNILVAAVSKHSTDFCPCLNTNIDWMKAWLWRWWFLAHKVFKPFTKGCDPWKNNTTYKRHRKQAVDDFCDRWVLDTKRSNFYSLASAIGIVHTWKKRDYCALIDHTTLLNLYKVVSVIWIGYTWNKINFCVLNSATLPIFSSFYKSP